MIYFGLKQYSVGEDVMQSILSSTQISLPFTNINRELVHFCEHYYKK